MDRYAAPKKYEAAHPEMRRAISQRYNAKRRALARDGRLNREELKAKQRVGSTFPLVEVVYGSPTRNGYYDRAVVRDGR